MSKKYCANDWSMEHPTLCINTFEQGEVELYMDEVQQVVAAELKNYIGILTEFKNDPLYEDETSNKTAIKHLKAVLKKYISRDDYKNFIKSL